MSTFQMRPFSHFQPILQLDLRWPLTLVYDLCMNIWRFPYYINKPSLVPIGLQLFKWGHFHIFSLSYNLTSDDLWPWYVTFDCMNIWRFPYFINKSSLVPIDIQLFKWGHFHILVYLTTWPQMTFDLDMWPLIASTNEGFHVASMTQLWLKSIKACGSKSQMLTHFHNNRQQQ